jgi:hypothetical protein
MSRKQLGDLAINCGDLSEGVAFQTEADLEDSGIEANVPPTIEVIPPFDQLIEMDSGDERKSSDMLARALDSLAAYLDCENFPDELIGEVRLAAHYIRTALVAKEERTTILESFEPNKTAEITHSED